MVPNWLLSTVVAARAGHQRVVAILVLHRLQVAAGEQSGQGVGHVVAALQALGAVSAGQRRVERQDDTGFGGEARQRLAQVALAQVILAHCALIGCGVHGRGQGQEEGGAEEGATDTSRQRADWEGCFHR
jgi:hypothetical protein